MTKLDEFIKHHREACNGIIDEKCYCGRDAAAKELAALRTQLAAYESRYVARAEDGMSFCLMSETEEQAKVLKLIMDGELTPIIGIED